MLCPLTALLLVACATQAPPSPPSFLIISFDTLRADRLGSYGSDAGLTPNLDRFASESVVFDRAYAQSSETVFSHASLFTGRYPSELAPVDDSFGLPDSVPTLAEVLTIHGYDTAAVVAGGYLSPGFGLERGFGSYRSVQDWGSLYHTAPLAQEWLSSGQRDEPFLMFLHGYDLHNRYLKPTPLGYSRSDPAYAGEASTAVRNHAGTTQMVYGYLHRREPFTQIFGEVVLRPWDQAVRGSIQKAAQSRGASPLTADDLDFVRGVYDGAASYADAQFGLLMAELDYLELLDEIVIVVLSDHGEELGEDGVFNHRHRLSEQTLRVPLVVRLPGGYGGGTRVDARVALLDVMPTLLEMAGATPPASMRGQSLTAALEGAPMPADRVLFAENAWRQIAAHDDAGGLVFAGMSPHSPYLAPVLASARADGPAFLAWPTTSDGDQARYQRELQTWRSSLPPTPGSERTVPSELRRVLRDQGYWEAP